MPILATNPDAQQGTLFGALNRCRIENESGALAVYTPYSPAFVADLKYRIPGHLRSWNPPKRAWVVDRSEGAAVQSLIKDHFGEDVELPPDVKKAYYRMARQWHPDVCREEDARERFEQIKRAYDVLSNPTTRKRYDLGLKLQKQAAQAVRAPRPKQFNNSSFGYSPDLRCGRITLSGYRSLGKIVVEHITAWEDIENERGEFLVSSWNFDTQQIQKLWVNRNVIF